MTLNDLNKEQRRIAETTDGILLVDAGPGTGKTHTAVERYMSIVSKNVPPADILMVTFTQNAAMEMGDRLRGRIKEEADNDPEKAEDLLRMMSEVRTSTFDSYCSRIVRANTDAVSDFFGIDARLSRSAVLESNDTLNEEHFGRFYSSFISAHSDWYGDVPALMANDEKELFYFIEALMCRGIIPMGEYTWFGDGEARIGGKLDILASMLREKVEDEKKLKGANCVKSPGRKQYYFDPEGTYFERVLYADGIPKVLTDDDIDSIVNEDRRKLLYFVHDIYYGYIEQSIRDNRLTFSLNALFAFVALYQSEESRVSMSVRYLMVDEFQDTNEMQMMICLMLLEEPNFCVVGDWKQGIYGFRNADVDNILQFGHRIGRLASILNSDGEHRVIPGIIADSVISIPLKRNYRSSEEILDAVFQVMDARIIKGDDHTGYGDSVIRLDADNKDFDGHTAVEVMYDADHIDGGEDELIARQIVRYVTDDSYRIKDGDGYRPARYGDIAVLMRTGNKCRSLYDHLRKRGIPAFLQGDVEIMSSVPGKLVLAWFRYVNDESDTRGLNTILVHMGLSRSQIDAMARDANYLDSIGRSRREAYPIAVTKQRDYLYKRRKRPTDFLTSVFAFHAIDEDPADADIAHAIINVISSSFSGSLVTIPDIIRLMEQDIENGTKYSVDALVGKDAVVIQTMHKSKGLEYPIVVVGGLDQYTLRNKPSGKQAISYDEFKGIRAEKVLVRNGDNAAIFKSWRSYMCGWANGSDYHETRRLLFVALSRAKQYLMLTSSFDRSVFFDGFSYLYGLSDIPPDEEPPSGGQDVRSEPPEIPAYQRRRTSMPVHDIMTYIPYEGEDGSDEDRGKEYGTRVHEAIQDLVHGIEPEKELTELDYARKVLASLEGADIIAERECSLPVGDVTLRGTIDLLAIWDDRAEIHDWKTDSDRRNHDSYVVQLSVYKLVVESVLKRPVRCFVQYVRDCEAVEIEPKTLEDIAVIVADTQNAKTDGS